MIILQLIGLLIVGTIILVIGIYKKNKWIIIISLIPLIISLWQVILLIGMGLH